MPHTSYVPYYRADRGKVVLRLIIDGAVAKVLDLGIRVPKEQWDTKTRKIIKHPYAKVLNEKINNKKHELEQQVTRAENLGLPITANQVKAIAEGKKITSDFYEYVTRRIPERYNNPDTAKHAFSDMRALQEFAPRLSFGDIDVRFCQRYHKWLRGKKLGINYPWKHLKFLRTFVNDADTPNGGFVVNNPFDDGSGFEMPAYVDPEKDGLTIAECDRIEALHYKDVPVMLKIAAAKFLFMCYSGLRISDAKRFRPDEHIKDGRLVIDIKKGDAGMLELKLWNRLNAVLVKLKELPVKNFADQTFNEWLKVVAQTADIERIPLTSHVGRHSFGCILAEMDIPLDVAMLMMKHKRVSTTKTYYKIKQHKMDAASDKLNELK